MGRRRFYTLHPNLINLNVTSPPRFKLSNPVHHLRRLRFPLGLNNPDHHDHYNPASMAATTDRTHHARARVFPRVDAGAVGDASVRLSHRWEKRIIDARSYRALILKRRCNERPLLSSPTVLKGGSSKANAGVDSLSNEKCAAKYWQ